MVGFMKGDRGLRGGRVFFFLMQDVGCSGVKQGPPGGGGGGIFFLLWRGSNVFFLWGKRVKIINPSPHTFSRTNLN